MLAVQLLALSPAGFTTSTARSLHSVFAPPAMVRTGHVRAILSEAVSPELLVGGTLSLGALLLSISKVSKDEDQGGEDKLAMLRREGAATIARREAVNSALDGRLDTASEALITAVEELEELVAAVGSDAEVVTAANELEMLVAIAESEGGEMIGRVTPVPQEIKAAPRQLEWWEKAPQC